MKQNNSINLSITINSVYDSVCYLSFISSGDLLNGIRVRYLQAY